MKTIKLSTGILIYESREELPNEPFNKLAITAINPTCPLKNPITPCGSCRQVLFEYEAKFNQPIELILSGEEGPIYHIHSVAELLPYAFHAGFLP